MFRYFYDFLVLFYEMICCVNLFVLLEKGLFEMKCYMLIFYYDTEDYIVFHKL